MLIIYLKSALFSTIYAISLRGQGRHTKTASAYMTAAVCGGAVLPPIMSPVASARGLRYSFCVVVALFAFGTVFPVYLSVVPIARKQVDPRIDVANEDEELDRGAGTTVSTEKGNRRRLSPSVKTVRRLTRVKGRKGGDGASSGGDIPAAEYKEAKTSSS